MIFSNTVFAAFLWTAAKRSICLWNTMDTLDTISPLSGCPGFWTTASIQNSVHIHSSWETVVEVSREVCSVKSRVCGTSVFFSFQSRRRAQQLGTVHEVNSWFLSTQTCSEDSCISSPAQNQGWGTVCIYSILSVMSPDRGARISISIFTSLRVSAALNMLCNGMPVWQSVSKLRWGWSSSIQWGFWDVLTACSVEWTWGTETKHRVIFKGHMLTSSCKTHLHAIPSAGECRSHEIPA